MVIWVVNALSKQYTTTIERTLIYQQLPETSLPDELPGKLITEISGSGFDLIKYQFNKGNRSIIINYDQLPPLVFTGNTSMVSTAQLLKITESDFKNLISLIYVSPQIIDFNSTERYSKKVPVNALLSFNFKKQFASSSALIIQPDSIYISGDSLDVESINELSTYPYEFNFLDKTLFHSLTIKPSEKSNINYSTDKIWVYMKVEPYTEGSVSIPINITKSGMKQITLIPASVSIKYHVPLSLYNKIQANQFEAIANLSNPIDINKLKVMITRMPTDISDVTISPQVVEFFIQQK